LYVKVAIPRPIDSLFDYHYDEKAFGEIKPGQLVVVPFGRVKLNACVVEVSEKEPELPAGIKIKSVVDKISEEFSMTPDIEKLCRFGSEYYQYPIGEAYFVAMPPHPEKILSTRGGKAKEVVATHKKLNEEQARVFSEMLTHTEQKNDSVFLLEGVTGSGKTEVYIEFAKEVLAQGKGVLILVPEIALTSQLKDRFERAMGVPIALWHSALADGLRQTQWRKVKTGEIKVVVGARSAIFAPFQDLGLIVVDEEHDQTYKQEERFRYQARDLALYRAKLLNIPIVLGSATPSLESIQRVREGKVHHLFLKNRYSTKPLPEIELVPLLEESMIITDVIKTPIAEKTVRTMQAVIDRGEQIIVFLNRRGFSQFIMCRDCGWIKKCSQCSISMTHYRRKNELRCHVCGTTAKVPTTCEECQGHELVEMGSGTESLEEELKLLLNHAKVLRLDRDQVTSQKRLEETLDSFRNLEANVLIGTQMLVKGHDFPKVTCVVVMMADMLLKWPDFRASERAFQTLIQVSGRAGRAELPGRVLIQGYDLDHPVIQLLMAGPTMEEDRKKFIEDELELRKLLFYPPFSRFVRYRFEHVDAQTLKNKVERLAEDLRQSEGEKLESRVMGPSEALLFRANNRYRYDLYFKAPTVESLFKVSRKVKKMAEVQELDLVVDVDPYSS
jgi:primosomal protein N' (replication factor Y)